jgi:hypothetical protein
MMERLWQKAGSGAAGGLRIFSGSLRRAVGRLGTQRSLPRKSRKTNPPLRVKSNNVKNFTNFSCEAAAQLLKHALYFAVRQATFYR